MLLIPKRWLIGAALVGWIIVLNQAHQGAVSDAEQRIGVRQLVPCVVRVSTDDVNVRTAPSMFAPVVGTLERGAVLPVLRTSGSFRQLGPGRWIGRWASAGFLDPLPGTNCG